MKKAVGYYEESVTWDCPYADCRELNTEDPIMNTGDIVQCSKCGKDTLIEIED